MAPFLVRDRLYEVDGLGGPDPGFKYECWDLAPDGPGFLGRIVVPADDGPDEVYFEFERPVSLSVLRRWIAEVPELSDGINADR